MGKRLKLRIYRVIASTLQSCRSKDPSILPKDPVPSCSAANHHHHLSSAFISVACAPPTATQPPQFTWQKEDNWHIVASLHHSPKKSSSEDDLVFAQPSPPPPERNRRRTKKKRNIPTRLRLSTSSADSGWFSSEGGGTATAVDEEETETLVSSSPPSSSELHPIGETQAFTATLPHRRSRRSKTASKRSKRGAAKPPPQAAAAEGETPARLSMFKKLIPCTVDGKVKESFAIVKKSADPYEDFKSSMMDMIVEKQMFEQKDLEQLLQCFLSLNSRSYHGIIVQAFSEIWTAIYSPAEECRGGGNCRRRVSRIASF